jgi:hypothetical protein
MSETILCLPGVEENDMVAPVVERAERRRPSDGVRIALIDNGKPKAHELLEYIAEELRARLPVASVELVSKSSAGVPIDADRAAAVAARSDMVIAALGDCGACSACSLHDAVQFEQLGLPSALIISDVFVGHIARFSETLGMPGYQPIVVPHPVSSKPDEWIRRLAREAADAVETQLVGTAQPLAAVR